MPSLGGYQETPHAPGCRALNNRELLCEVFSCAERRGLAVQHGMEEAHHGHQAMGDSPTIPSPQTGTFLGNAGTYISHVGGHT